jgi:hypothetical protein
MDEDHVDEKDPDMMDWTPTDPSASSSSKNINRSKQVKDDDDGSWLRRQRFFPPEQPTGLEGLFARTLLVDEQQQPSVQQGRSPRLGLRLNWLWVGALLIVPLLTVAYRLWWRWDLTITRTSSNIITTHIIDYDGAI